MPKKSLKTVSNDSDFINISFEVLGTYILKIEKICLILTLMNIFILLKDTDIGFSLTIAGKC